MARLLVAVLVLNAQLFATGMAEAKYSFTRTAGVSAVLLHPNLAPLITLETALGFGKGVELVHRVVGWEDVFNDSGARFSMTMVGVPLTPSQYRLRLMADVGTANFRVVSKGIPNLDMNGLTFGLSLRLAIGTTVKVEPKVELRHIHIEHKGVAGSVGLDTVMWGGGIAVGF